MEGLSWKLKHLYIIVVNFFMEKMNGIFTSRTPLCSIIMLIEVSAVLEHRLHYNFQCAASSSTI